MLTVEQLNAFSVGTLPGLLGIQITGLEPSKLTSQLMLRPALLAANGYLHAGTIVTLADTSCGYGTFANLPAGAQGFTTIELKSNFIGTALEGMLICTATQLHNGRTTQVWDATVSDDKLQKTIAMFRCTQLILYPR